MQSGLTSWTLLTATAGLLAFLVGVYTLIGRDRKSPYLINSVFFIFLICLVGAVFDIAAQISPWLKNELLLAGAVTFLLALVITISRLWTIYMRLAYFIDPGGLKRFKFLPVIRQLRSWRKSSHEPTYEYDPVPLGEDLRQEVANIVAADGAADGANPSIQFRNQADRRALAMALQHLGQANDILGRLAMAFLKQPDHYVQYMTASRHPIEFIHHLRENWDAKGIQWQQARARLVAVDAYTPHFGFLDSINDAKTRELRNDLGDRLLSATETFAGAHSASSAAFKLVKRNTSPPRMRQPTLVIYEDMYALSDLESVEQYRIFARHVLPSEQLWDGMFTIFAETAQREEDWKLVSSYAGMMVDLRNAPSRAAAAPSVKT